MSFCLCFENSPRVLRLGGVALWCLLVLGGCTSALPPRHAAAVLSLEQQASAAYEQGDMAQALAHYRGLVQALPNDENAWFRLGNVYARLDQPQEAIDAYRHVLSRDSTHAKAWHNMGVMLARQAQAAFAESAQSAGRDTALRSASAEMAERLSALNQVVASPVVAKPPGAKALQQPGAQP